MIKRRILLITASILVLSMGIVTLFFFHNHLILKVIETSMSPTLVDGEYILVKKMTGNISEIHSGDIVVFKRPHDNVKVVKRVVLTEGDPIIIDFGWLCVDDKRYFLEEEEASRLSNYRAVPAGTFFAVGDNTLNSCDSRTYGFIPARNFVGRVLLKGASAR